MVTTKAANEEQQQMSRTGDQQTFQQAAQQAKATTTTTNYKAKAREFSEGIKARMKNQVPKEEELEKRIQSEQAILMINCNEQKHKLKKFLQLSKQLQKPKDEKKIKELLQILKETNKPLPYSVIKELKMLEMMNSPYSQPLMGMIKDIETQINKKFGGDQTQQNTRPQTLQKKHRREYSDATVPRTQEQLTIIKSSRRLELAIEAYNKDNHILVHTLSASIGSSQSRGSSRDDNTGLNSIRPGGIRQSKTKLQDLQSESGASLSNKLSTPKRNFAHNTPFPVHISDNKKAQKSGRSSRRESHGSSRGRDQIIHHRNISQSSQDDGTGTSNQTSNRRRTNVLSNKSQKEALKSKETSHIEKSAKRSKSKRSRNQSSQSQCILGRLVGTKTTLGASENSLLATQYTNQSEENVIALNQRQLSRNRMLMAGVMTTGTHSSFSPIKQVLIEHENEESVIEVQVQGMSPSKKMKKGSFNQYQQQIVIPNMRKGD